MSEQTKKMSTPTTCSRCGDCCKKGSPTLKLRDLELLSKEQIPWNQVYTLRKGEPVHSPIADEAYYLPSELIKVREKPGSKECVFLGDDNLCTIYDGRPAQCEAQACWDPDKAVKLADEQALERSNIFAAVEPLLRLIEEHDKRCSFDDMREAFEDLKQSQGKSADQVVEFLAFEDHFRNFVAEQLKIPAENLDLVFGRSLADRVGLFGFEVETAQDGTHTLVPQKK